LQDVPDVGFDGLAGKPEAFGDSPVGEAFGHEGEDRRLAIREFVERIRGTGTIEEKLDELGVDHDLAAGEPLQSVDEVTGLGDSVLQQVAAALAAAPRSVRA
jgi:hypothetical protein